MKYRTETHLHTSEVSHCGHLCASEMVERYHAAGYRTLFISDHFTAKYFQRMAEQGAGYEEGVRCFFEGYRAAKRAAEPYGMTVLPAAEVTFSIPNAHFLLYGASEDFFLSHKDLYRMSPQEFYPIAKQNGIFVVQAHPFRKGVPPYPECVDAIEVYNSNPRHLDEMDEAKSTAAALAHGLPVTAGSDAHRPEDVARSGVASDEPITSAKAYVDLLRAGKLSLIRNGEPV